MSQKPEGKLNVSQKIRDEMKAEREAKKAAKAAAKATKGKSYKTVGDKVDNNVKNVASVSIVNCKMPQKTAKTDAAKEVNSEAADQSIGTCNQ